MICRLIVIFIMGKSFFKENWETEFKEDVRNIQKGSGLTVSSNRQGNLVFIKEPLATMSHLGS